MPNTLYATFADPTLAERAAGALLDYGVRAEDISLVQNTDGSVTQTTGTQMGTMQSPSGPGSQSVGSLGMIGSSLDEEGANARDRMRADEVASPPRMEDETLVNPSRLDEGTTITGSRPDYEYNTMMVEREGGVVRTGGIDSTPYEGTPDYSAFVNEDTDLVDDADNAERAAKEGISTTTPADAGAGAIKGTGIGLGIGALAAIASIAIPGFGLILGGGALAAALGGVAASAGAGAAAGAVFGYLKDQGMDQPVAESYSQSIQGGGAILAIHVPSGRVDESTVRSVLDKYAAQNVNNFATNRGPGYVS